MSNGDVTNVGSQPVSLTQLREATDRVDKALEAKDLKEVRVAADALATLVGSDSSIPLDSEQNFVKIRYDMDQEIKKISEYVEKPFAFLNPEGDVEKVPNQDALIEGKNQALIQGLNEACEKIEHSKEKIRDGLFKNVKEKVEKQVRELPRKHKESKLSDWIGKVAMPIGVTGLIAGMAFSMVAGLFLFSIPLIILGGAITIGSLLLTPLGGWLTYLIAKPSKDKTTQKDLESKWYQKNDAVRLQKVLNEDEGLVKRVFLAEPSIASSKEAVKILEDDIALYKQMVDPKKAGFLNDEKKEALQKAVKEIYDNKEIEKEGGESPYMHQDLREFSKNWMFFHRDIRRDWNEGKMYTFVWKMEGLVRQI